MNNSSPSICLKSYLVQLSIGTVMLTYLPILALAFIIGACSSSKPESEMQADQPAPEMADENLEPAVVDTATVVMAGRVEADAWLGLIDKGSYGDSYDKASELFKQQLTKNQWIDTVDGIGEQVGGIKDRSLESAEYSTEVPQAPPGEYIILKYFSGTTVGQDIVETVVLMNESDIWKVSGYFLAPR